ncbi:MAG TPA: apolipoprotein N-acyltransferase [bacterium]
MSRSDWAWTALSAGLLVLGFAPSPLGFLSIVALVPLFHVLRKRQPFDAFRAGYVVGFLWASGTFYWIAWPTIAGFLGVLLIMPLVTGVFCLLLSRCIRLWGEGGLWAAPFLWVMLEVVTSYGQLAFPWNLLGNTLAAHPVWIQYAAITGVYGVSFWIVSMNVLIRRVILNPAKGRIVPILLLILPLAWGLAVQLRPFPGVRTLRVSLVQGNIDAYKKWTPEFIDSSFIVYDRMTRRIREQDPDLVLWPETATPCYLRHNARYWNWVRSLVDSLDVPLLTGAPDYAFGATNRIETYNAAFLFEPGSPVIGYYYKRHLVPFSEKIPFSETFPKMAAWVNRIVPDSGDYTAGDSTTVLNLRTRMHSQVSFSVAICFESIFPDLVRRFVSKGADFLVIITNDGWFGNTSGPRQHAAVAVLRAIENRRWVVRCANTGISECIDPYGRITDKTHWNQSVNLTRTISVGGPKTFYTEQATFISLFFLSVGGLIAFASILRKPNRFPLFQKRRRNPS